MGFTLNQLEQERQIRKLQKKEDKDTSNYEQLSNLPKINNVELKGDKTTSDLGINADNVMLSDGVTSVEDALDNMHMKSNIVTLPYTPPTDGIIIASIRGGSTAGHSHVLFSGTQPNLISANITTNQFYNGVLAVKKGVPISISESDNIYATDPYRFYFINISTN